MAAALLEIKDEIAIRKIQSSRSNKLGDTASDPNKGDLAPLIDCQRLRPLSPTSRRETHTKQFFSHVLSRAPGNLTIQGNLVTRRLDADG